MAKRSLEDAIKLKIYNLKVVNNLEKKQKNLEVESVIAPAESLSLDKLVTDLAFVTVQQIMTVYTQGLVVSEKCFLLVSLIGVSINLDLSGVTVSLSGVIVLSVVSLCVLLASR